MHESSFDVTSLREFSTLLESKQVSSVELVQHFERRFTAHEPSVQAFLLPLFEQALIDAEKSDQLRADGQTGPLLGIPYALKDILCTEGIRTTAGSRILENYNPPYDATAVEKLKAAGAVLLGKLNMDEFAMGSSCENSAYQTTFNPWNLELTPGGSSGGSSAAVAAGEAPVALGTDTGGSIRQPASFCNVVGMKPTYGRISRYGLIAFASSLDQVGTLSRRVEDSAMMLNVLAGKDVRDSTSYAGDTPDFLSGIGKDIAGMRIGLPKEYFVEGLDDDIRARVDEAVKVFEGEGALIEEVSLPHTEYAISTYYLCATAEASSNLARFDGVGFGHRCKDPEDIIDMFARSRTEGFGTEVKRRIMLGSFVLSSGYYEAYYDKAQRSRTLVIQDFNQAFEKVDLILTPVSPVPPFKIGEKIEDPLQMYLADVFTVPASLAGLPGISVPAGFTGADKRPAGIQLIAPAYQEERMFQAAHAYEDKTRFYNQTPPLIRAGTS